PHARDLLALAHAITHLHLDRREVEEGGAQLEAVIDDEGAAGQIEIGLGQRHDAIGGGCDRRADGTCDIDAEMGLPRLAVQDAQTAEDAGDGALNWPDEAASEERLVDVAGARLVDEGLLRLDAREELGGRAHHRLGQAADALDLIAALRHGECALFLPAVGVAYGERCLGSCLIAEADDEAAVGGDLDRLAVEHHAGSRLDLAEEKAALRRLALEAERPR